MSFNGIRNEVTSYNFNFWDSLFDSNHTDRLDG